MIDRLTCLGSRRQWNWSENTLMTAVSTTRTRTRGATSTASPTAPPSTPTPPLMSPNSARGSWGTLLSLEFHILSKPFVVYHCFSMLAANYCICIMLSMYVVLPNMNFLQFSDKPSDIFDFKLVERTAKVANMRSSPNVICLQDCFLIYFCFDLLLVRYMYCFCT